MKWIKALDLERWSHVISARTAFPGMIADLIRATASDITAFRFPNGDKGQVRGFDGWLDAAGVSPFVPDGRSIWEFGVRDGVAKADKDYEKRTKQLPPVQRAKTTFVFATLQTWDNPKKNLQDWVSEKRDRKEWKNVEYYDGTALEHWLDLNPAVAARYARFELGIQPKLGAQSLDEFWYEYSNKFRPQLSEAVLLCEREKQAEELLSNLGRGPGRFMLAADSPDEVIAFATAAVRKSDPAVRLFYEARCLVVDTEDAARQLATKKGLIFLPRQQALNVSGILVQSGATLVALGADQPNRQCELLVRPSSSNLGKAIATMGLDDNRAYELARSCGRSVTILSRLIPSGAAAKPGWLPEGRKLVPALLAGGWDSFSESDRAIVSALAGGRSYYDYEADLRPFRRMQDPPLDQAQTIWKIRAPVDAFVHIGHLIGPDDLERLKEAVTAVFSRIAPPTADEPFQLNRRQPNEHSSWLREGLATTLLLIASLGEQADLVVPGTTPQDYVDEIVRGLPGLATDPRVITSLEGQLPLLAEAAPRPLLSALEQMLEGDGHAMRPIFNEIDNILAPSSPHICILWALETLAWDPALLLRVSMILAKLARIDPGGRLSNRPINSLRAIFLPWTPRTNAPLSVRLSAIDAIVRKYPEIGWELLKELLPRGRDTSSPTTKPRFREAGGSEREVLTWGLVWESQREIVNRVLTLADNDPSRWVTIGEHLYNFEPEQRLRALEQIEAYLDRAPVEDRNIVWACVRDELNRHRTFTGTDWALGPEDIRRLEEVVRRHEPADLIEREVWLFDDWAPDVPGRVDEDRNVIDEARQDAVRRIVARTGVEGLLSLARKAKLPQFVANTAIEIAERMSFAEEILIRALGGDKNLDHFAAVASAAAARKFGDEWLSCIRRTATAQGWNAETIATLFLSWPEERKTWSAIDGFGEEAALSYWKRKVPWGVCGDVGDAEFAARQYLKVGRPSAGLEAVRDYAQRVSPNIVFDLLASTVKEINDQPERLQGLLVHHIQDIFEKLAKRDDIDMSEIAQWEYIYLPILGSRDKELTIHQLMAEQPAFYVSVIRDVFRPESQEAGSDGEPSSRDPDRARVGYRLLSSFQLVPGMNAGTLDVDKLRSWILEVRRMGKESDRATIADQYVGRVLAHAPHDPVDGVWPHRGVRDLLEELDSNQIERGLEIERFNMRGPYWKDLYEGGKQERELATKARESAQVTLRWVRTSAMMERIAQSWEYLAEDEDRRAQQAKLRE